MEKIVIGSFNVRGLQQKDSKDQDFQVIADIINGNTPITAHAKSRQKEKTGMHIVALQEVVNEDQFYVFLSDYLGRDKWDGWFGKPDSRSPYYAKGYAYIWQKAYVDLMYGEKSKNEQDRFEPHIFTQYEDTKNIHFDVSAVNSLARPPLYARFRIKDCNTEIRLLNTHIAFGQSKNTYDEEEKMSVVENRRKEIRILCEVVYPVVNQIIYKNGFNNFYTFILGDFNLNLDRPQTKGNRVVTSMKKKNPEIMMSLSPMQRGAVNLALYESLPKIDREVYETESGQKIVIRQDQLTTLKNSDFDDSKETKLLNQFRKKGIGIDNEAVTVIKKLSSLAEDEFKVYHSNYDHIAYDENSFEGVGLETPKRMDDVITQFFVDGDEIRSLAEGAELYKKKVSDHIPIMIGLDLRNGK